MQQRRGRAHGRRPAGPLHRVARNDALPHVAYVQRGRRSLPQYPRAARGAARGATPQGRQDIGEEYDQATPGVEARRGGGGDRRGLPGRGQDEKVEGVCKCLNRYTPKGVCKIKKYTESDIGDTNGVTIPAGTGYITSEQRRKFNCLTNNGMFTPYTNCEAISQFDNVTKEKFNKLKYTKKMIQIN